MTDTPEIDTPAAEVDTPVEIDAEPVAPVAEPATANCRHCGAAQSFDGDVPEDWPCPECDRWQDSMSCPTCHSVVRISLMPADLAPEVHAPQRRRKKEA